MKITREKAREIVKEWGWKRLPRSGRRYLRVGCGYTQILENCKGQYYYGWINGKGQVSIFGLLGIIYTGFVIVVLLVIF